MANKKENKRQASDEAVVDEMMAQDDGSIYLSERRLREFSPEDIELLFGIPKDKQRVGWYTATGKPRASSRQDKNLSKQEKTPESENHLKNEQHK